MMQPSKLDSNLKQFLVTTDDRVAMLHAISALKKVQFSTNPDALATTLASEIAYDVAQALSGVITQEHPPTFEDLESWLLALPVVTLTLAIAPTRSQLQSYQEILQKNLHAEVIVLQVHVQPQLLAGVQIEIHGTYRDYSLKTALDSFVHTPAYQAILTKHLQ